MPFSFDLIWAGLVSLGLMIGGALLAANLDAIAGEVVEEIAEEVTEEVASSLENTSRSDSSLTVVIDGIRNDQGKIYVLVFDEAEAFAAVDLTRAVSVAVVTAQTGSVATSFPDLTDGKLAVVIHHDENEDEQFNINQDGLPLEGYGWSGPNKADREPSFEEAAISPGNVTIGLHYVL